MADNKKLPSKWEKEQRVVKAIQVAFDLSEEAQLQIRTEALNLGINPSDRVRQILGLPVHPRPKRPRLSISLSPKDFQLLSEKFKVNGQDRATIRQKATESLLTYTTTNRKN